MPDKELMITLWNCCNGRCDFCYNSGYYHYPINIKDHLNNCLTLLKSDIINDYVCIRLVGGELLNGIIDELNIKKEFDDILNQIYFLIEKGIIEKVNIVTNLMFLDRKDLCYVLDLFGDKITLSTSYDIEGRFFNSAEEILWRNNIKFLQQNYPKLKVDVGINITQPLLIKIKKSWLDNLQEYLGDYTINFNELFAGIDNTDKQLCTFKDYFPKRKDFIRFLQKLYQWNYLNCIIGTKNTKLIHYVFKKDGSVGFVDTDKIMNQGYIDSDVAMCDDIRRFRNANR